MQSKFLEKRVDILERTVGGLSELPARVEAVEGQILQLRTEMHGEFSAIRTEAGAFKEDVYAFRGEMYAFRQEMYAFKDDMTAFKQEVRDEFVQVRAEIMAGDEETRVQMRVLHEDTLSRVRLLAEAVDDTRQQVRVLRDTAALTSDVAALRTSTEAFHREVTTRLSAIADQLSRRRRR